jgi:hypothetical protein
MTIKKQHLGFGLKLMALSVALLFIVIPQLARSQGSPYGFFGFGDPVYSTHSRLHGISESGVALTDGSFVNTLNPASWTNITRTSIDIGLRYGYDQSSLGGDQTSYKLFKISGLNAGIPVSSASHIALALGAAPASEAEAKTTRSEDIGSTVYRREGGLSALYLGIAGKPMGALSLGIRGDILFGNIRTASQATVFGSDVEPSLFQREYALSGIRENISFQLLLDSFVRDLHGFTIGASYTTSSSLTSKQRTIVTPMSTNLDSTIEVEGYGYYPSQISIGIAGRFGDRYRLEADIVGQDFSNSFVFAKTKDAPGDPQLGTFNRFSFGLERLALIGEDARNTTFWERAGLRFGLAYAQLPYHPSAGVTVNEMSASLGLGFPFASGSMIDLSTELGIRTPSDASIAPKDLFIKVGATITVSEKWFVPLKRQDDE